VKTESFGNVQWQNTFGGTDADLLFSIQQAADGGYILGGFSRSNISGDKTENCLGGQFYGDYWMVKTDEQGNIEWQNTIGGSDDDMLYSIQQTADVGYILSGHSRSNISGDKTENCNGNMDYWIVKTDTAGNIQWQNTIGGNDWDELRSIKQTVDGGYILGGYSYSNISGDKTENSNGNDDYWIVKLFPDTITGIADSPLERGKGCVAFPNPATDKVTVSYHGFENSLISLKLFDLLGQEILFKQFQTTSNPQTTLDISAINSGVYLLNLTNEKTGERMNGKIVVSD